MVSLAFRNSSNLIHRRLLKITAPLVGLFACITVPHSAEAAITLKVEQIGSDVHVIGSGSANLTALTSDGYDTAFQNIITQTQIFAGESVFSGSQVDFYINILTGPATVSSDSNLTEEPDPSLSMGDIFGIQTDPYTLVLPQGYASNTPLSSLSVYKNLTLAQLGLTPGLSSWTWGSTTDGTFDSINLEVVPGPLPLAGAGVAYGWSTRLRRRIARSQ
jgi:hypothetical protein